METEKAELLMKTLTFDTAVHPRWVGDVGKCFVDAETETMTIVGWREEMGYPTNNYRLVIKPELDGVSLVGYSDTSKPIKLKVLGISMDEALSRMLSAAENGRVAVAALAQTVIDPSPQYCDTEPRPVGTPEQQRPAQGCR